jgi:hypothetical protein
MLIRGIPVKAESSLAADSLTWETVFAHVRSALNEPLDWDTRVTAIDVQDASGALAS